MKRLISLMMIMCFSVLIFSGCGKSKSDDKAKYGESSEIKIAILGSREQYDVRKDFLVGVDLAIEELKEKGLKVSYEHIDDGSSSDKGVALAKDIAKDNKYALAFTLQTNEIVDSIAPIFEEAKKPLFIINECFDSTMQNGYNYIFAGVISAEDGGNALAEFCMKNNIEWAVAAHSGTQYETTFARGFSNAISNSNGGKTTLLDSVTGPFNESEFLDIWRRWSILDAQAVLISFDDIDWACDVVRMLRGVNKDILILGDAKFNDISKLKEYEELEGMIVAGSYGVDSNERVQDFYDLYEARMMREKNIDITTVTAQGYDFTHMIAQRLSVSGNMEEFIRNMKSSEGYEGVTGVKFRANGQLSKVPTYWTVKEGQMHRLNKN